MAADPLSRTEAMKRVFEAGRRSGLFGSPSDSNPYASKPSMREESTHWAAGHAEGFAEWKRRKGK